ncbi:MAG: Holliday junction resolvase RuvX [Ruminococcaceae bacterium]|nr:Holliday junction resolvase RuvX [Oscillospiraceae bacterium]
MGRILGIDYGDRRVGISVSDPLGITAQGVCTLENKVFEKMMENLEKIIEEYKPAEIVLGMPKNMDGSIGFRGEITLEFKERLEKISNDAKIVLWDERLTTVSADRIFHVTGTKGKDRKKVVDTVAASIILQSYLDSK